MFSIYLMDPKRVITHIKKQKKTIFLKDNFLILTSAFDVADALHVPNLAIK